jgi:hypothetical protein
VAGRGGIEWNADTLSAKLLASNGKALSYLTKTTAYNSLAAEGWSKKNAPWRDRSSNARNSLSSVYRAGLFGGSSKFEIDIAHGMYYGIFLELKNGGRYSIIDKTVAHQGPIFMRMADKVIQRMFGGGA